MGVGGWRKNVGEEDLPDEANGCQGLVDIDESQHGSRAYGTSVPVTTKYWVEGEGVCRLERWESWDRECY